MMSSHSIIIHDINNYTTIYLSPNKKFYVSFVKNETFSDRKELSIFRDFSFSKKSITAHLMSAQNKAQEDFIRLVNEKGGTVLSTVITGIGQLDLRCSRGHVFKETMFGVKRGKWCPSCVVLPGLTNLYKILEDNGISYQKDAKLDQYQIDIDIPISGSNHFYIDVIAQQNLTATMNKFNTLSNKYKYILWVDNDESYDVMEGVVMSLLDSNSNSVIYNSKPIENKVSENKVIENKPLEEVKTPMQVRPKLTITKSIEEKVAEEKKIIRDTKRRIIEEVDKELTDNILPKIRSAPAFNFNRKAVVGYIRVSTEEQKREGISLDAQRFLIEKYAAEAGVHVREIYTDAGISGKTIRGRPAIIKCQKELQRGEEVVCANVSRLSRNMEELLRLDREISEKGALLRCLDIDGDMSRSDTRMYFMIKGTLAEIESRLISERTSQALCAKRRKGLLITKPCYGFKSPGKGLDHVPDPEEQQVIEYIRQLRKRDPTIPVAEIVRTLNKLPNTKRRLAEKWHPNLVTSILRRNNIK